MKKYIIILISMLILPVVFSQEALKTTEDEYYDFLSLIGSFPRPTLGYRTLSDSEYEVYTMNDEFHIWKNNNLGSKYTLFEKSEQNLNWFTCGINENINYKVFAPEWFNSYNSEVPYGQNDGALWQGKGYNSSLTFGARIEAYGFEVTFKPQLCYSQNKEYDYLIDRSRSAFSLNEKGSEYGYLWGNIDLPQRFGDSYFYTYDWGDTELRWTWYSFTLGAGFQSPWLGPAWLNPMLGSNNASTYPKIDIGFRKTKIFFPRFKWYIGEIEGRIWCGKLTESKYYDNNPENNERMLNGISASYSPSFIPGFTFGINRIFITNWAKHNLKYIGRLFTLSHRNGSQEGNGEDEDQKISIFIDWLLPNVGFEVYGELGIDDFTSEKLSNPFHTAIYTIGVKQCVPLPVSKISEKVSDLKSELIFEWNNFEMSQDFQMQWQYMGYYAHGQISQGYTQKGQILGAGTGYFGNSQFLGYKVYFPKGYIMPFYHRQSPDTNYIYNISVGKAIDSTSEEFKRYYGLFKTYRTMGVELSFFATKNLNFTGSLVSSFINYPNYNKQTIGIRNYRGTLKIKYNLL